MQHKLMAVELTEDVLGHMVPWDLAGLAVSNPINGCHSELVICAVHKASHQEIGGLELFGNITFGPVLSLSSLALYQVSHDLTTTIVSWFSPSQTDGTLCGINHLGEGGRTRRIWNRQKVSLIWILLSMAQNTNI